MLPKHREDFAVAVSSALTAAYFLPSGRTIAARYRRRLPTIPPPPPAAAAAALAPVANVIGVVGVVVLLPQGRQGLGHYVGHLVFSRNVRRLQFENWGPSLVS